MLPPSEIGLGRETLFLPAAAILASSSAILASSFSLSFASYRKLRET